MKGKGILLISLIFNVVLIALLMFVKKESTASAKAAVEEFNAGIKKNVAFIKGTKIKNNVLWSIALEAADTDQSLKSVKALIESKKFPAIKNIAESPVALSESKTDAGVALKASSDKYSITFAFITPPAFSFPLNIPSHSTL